MAILHPKRLSSGREVYQPEKKRKKAVNMDQELDREVTSDEIKDTEEAKTPDMWNFHQPGGHNCHPPLWILTKPASRMKHLINGHTSLSRKLNTTWNRVERIGHRGWAKSAKTAHSTTGVTTQTRRVLGSVRRIKGNMLNRLGTIQRRFYRRTSVRKPWESRCCDSILLLPFAITLSGYGLQRL